MTSATFCNIIYTHKKTGKRYILIMDNIINSTNKNDGELMVLYRNEDNQYFTRERNEFYSKFEKVIR